MSDGGMDHEVLLSELAFDGRLVKVFIDDVRLPDGRRANWERVAHPGAVGMVPLLRDGSLLLVRQFRNAVGGDLLEIPAGKLDRGEEPEDCARRELIEEVGHSAGELLKLAEFYNSPGYSDEYFHLYLARELEPQEGELEDDEFLTVERVDLTRALSMVSSGEIRDAKSIIGIAISNLFLKGGVAAYTGRGKA